MAQVYACVMEQKRNFTVLADNDDQVMEWLQTHSFQDVDNLTKNYGDEYNEGICGYGNEDPELKADFDIRKEKETVNDKLERLKSLIEESKKVREDVKAETKRLQAEHLENKRAQYEKLCEILKPYFELCNGLRPYEGANYPDVFLAVDNESRYEIRFEQPSKSIGVAEAIHDGHNHWIGRFDIRDAYEASYKRLSSESYLTHEKTFFLDDFMDTFDESVLEESFSQMVTEQLAKLAAETDAKYQEAKSELEKDNRKE